MQIQLTLRRSGNTLVYGLPLWYRLFSSLVVLILVLSAIMSGGLGIPGNIIIGLALLAALYEERWTLDLDTRRLSGRVGLVVVARSQSIPFMDIERIRVDTFAKGRLDQKALQSDEKMPPGSQVRLIVDTKTGSSIMIESAAFRQKAAMLVTARSMAEAMHVPLED